MTDRSPPQAAGDDAVALRRAARRGALCGALGALAVVAMLIAALGFAGAALANQTLLANLRVHAAATSGLLWLTAAAAGWRRVGLLGAVGAAALIAGAAAGIRWTAVAPAPDALARLDIVSFNVLLDNTAGGPIADWLIAAAPDVAVILEAAPLAPHLERLSAIFPHRIGCEVGACDLLVLSATPLSEAVLLQTPDGLRRLAIAQVQAGDESIWLAATHWPKDFFIGRGDSARQIIREIRRRMRAGPTRVVLAGDFNAMPWDPSLKFMNRRLDLRHPAVWRPTWPVAIWPVGAQIDHVLVSPGLRVEALEAGRDIFGSNHRALTALIAITPGPRTVERAAKSLADASGRCVNSAVTERRAERSG